MSGTSDDLSLAALAFDFLLEQRPNGTLAPSLASSEPTLANGGIARDRKHIVFRLRSGVRWQDGAPFTSADVAFTVREILDPKLPIATRVGYDDIESVQTPSPLTVVFTLKRAYAPFVATIALNYPIVPKHLLEHSANVLEDPFGTEPIGTGPYRFVRQARGDRIEYEANPLYWSAKPKINRVTVFEIPNSATMAIELRSGQLDFMIASSSQFVQLRNDQQLAAGIVQANIFSGLALNTTRAPLDDVRVRRAISMAVNRGRITRDTTFGTAISAYADLPAFLWESQGARNPYAYNAVRARALLDVAGWRVGRDGIRVKAGKPLHLSFITMSGSAGLDAVNIEIQSMLTAVGIEAELKSYSPSLYYAPGAGGGPWAAGDFDLATDENMGGPDPDDSDILTCANREPSGFNAARYCSQQMDSLQRASLEELDPVKRRAIVARIEELVATDVPYVFLYNSSVDFVHARSLQHATPSPTTYFYRVEDWSFSS